MVTLPFAPLDAAPEAAPAAPLLAAPEAPPDALAELSLEIDDVYKHLVRDLGAKRKWLEKAIIFRRYLPTQDLIPQSLNWGRCEKGTRRVAERLRDGLPLG